MLLLSTSIFFQPWATTSVPYYGRPPSDYSLSPRQPPSLLSLPMHPSSMWHTSPPWTPSSRCPQLSDLQNFNLKHGSVGEILNWALCCFTYYNRFLSPKNQHWYLSSSIPIDPSAMSFSELLTYCPRSCSFHIGLFRFPVGFRFDLGMVEKRIFIFEIIINIIAIKNYHYL